MSSTRDVARALAAPAQSVANALIAIPEDQWLERKSVRVRPAALANALVGMANADGGTIVIGLSDGNVEGLDAIGARAASELQQVPLDHCEPPVPAQAKPVDVVRADGRTDRLLVFEVRSGDHVYATTRGEIYLRVGDSTRKLASREAQELVFDRGQGTYEARPAAEATSNDLDAGLLGSYAESLGAPDADRLLVARGLATSAHTPTIAGLLLFGLAPQRSLPEALVRVIRYQGTQRGTGSRQEIIDDVRIEGPIPQQLLEAQDLVQRLQPTRRALGPSGRFEAVPLVPSDAWLEGIVNAVVHRSYSLGGDHIRVEIFTDRIEITSPGRFPGIFQPRDPLNSPRYARNPRIARVCADLQFGQELGEGIRRMFSEMETAGLQDPLYQQTEGNVRLTLSAELADRELEARLPRGAREITSALKRSGPMSTGEVADLLGVTRVTARTRLDALHEAGIVDWDGKSARDPRASWRLRGT